MILATLLMAWCAFVQAQQPPATDASASKLVEQARAARAKGDVKEAARLAADAFERQPSSRDGAALKIELDALSGDLAGAFDTYDRYVNAGGRATRTLLVPIARAELRKLQDNELSEIRGTALASLTVAGDGDAKKALERASQTTGTSAVAADAALARLGDERAAARFANRIRQGSLSAKLSAIEAVKDLGTAPPPLASAIVAALDDPQGPVRAAAAQAAGPLKISTAIPALRRALGESSPYLVRLSAAVSLRQLGDGAGDQLLRQALTSDLAEARTFAARAYTVAEARVWRPAIEPLLTSATGLDALNAAELLLPLKLPAAQTVVEKAAADPNPSIRARAARVAAREPNTSPALIRRLLADDAPMVRLYAADGTTRLEGPATLKR